MYSTHSSNLSAIFIIALLCRPILGSIIWPRVIQQGNLPQILKRQSSTTQVCVEDDVLLSMQTYTYDSYPFCSSYISISDITTTSVEATSRTTTTSYSTTVVTSYDTSTVPATTVTVTTSTVINSFFKRGAPAPTAAAVLVPRAANLFAANAKIAAARDDPNADSTLISSVSSGCSCLHLSPNTIVVPSTTESTRTLTAIEYDKTLEYIGTTTAGTVTVSEVAIVAPASSSGEVSVTTTTVLPKTTTSIPSISTSISIITSTPPPTLYTTLPIDSSTANMIPSEYTITQTMNSSSVVTITGTAWIYPTVSPSATLRKTSSPTSSPQLYSTPPIDYSSGNEYGVYTSTITIGTASVVTITSSTLIQPSAQPTANLNGSSALSAPPYPTVTSPSASFNTIVTISGGFTGPIDVNSTATLTTTTNSSESFITTNYITIQPTVRPTVSLSRNHTRPHASTWISGRTHSARPTASYNSSSISGFPTISANHTLIGTAPLSSFTTSATSTAGSNTTSIVPDGCPEINGTVYTVGSDGEVYQILCQEDFLGPETVGLKVSSFRSCIQQCSNTNDGFSSVQCQAVSYYPTYSEANCFLRGSTANRTVEAIDFVEVVSGILLTAPELSNSSSPTSTAVPSTNITSMLQSMNATQTAGPTGSFLSVSNITSFTATMSTLPSSNVSTVISNITLTVVPVGYPSASITPSPSYNGTAPPSSAVGLPYTNGTFSENGGGGRGGSGGTSSDYILFGGPYTMTTVINGTTTTCTKSNMIYPLYPTASVTTTTDYSTTTTTAYNISTTTDYFNLTTTEITTFIPDPTTVTVYGPQNTDTTTTTTVRFNDVTTTTTIVDVTEPATTLGTVTVTPSDYTVTYPTEYTTVTVAYPTDYPVGGPHPVAH